MARLLYIPRVDREDTEERIASRRLFIEGEDLMDIAYTHFNSAYAAGVHQFGDCDFCIVEVKLDPDWMADPDGIFSAYADSAAFWWLEDAVWWERDVAQKLNSYATFSILS